MTTRLLTLSDIDCCEMLNYALNNPAHKGKEAPGYRDAVLLLVMVDAGLRVGEAVRLRIANITHGHTIAESVYVPSLISKTKQERYVPMTERLKDALKKFLQCHRYCDNLQGSCFLFCSPTPGRHISTRQAERIIRNNSFNSIGRIVHPHALRHTFATRLLRVTNMRNVQMLLGHKHLTSTQIYTHPNSEDLKKAVQGLG